MARTSSARVELGRRLRALRVAAGFSRENVARAAGCSYQHIGHIEQGRNAPTDEHQLLAIARHYGVGDDIVGELKRLWVDAARAGWWSAYGVSGDYGRYIAMETEADEMLAWAPLNIPGLIQTESYMRYKYELEVPRLSRRKIDKLVRTRLYRQLRISGGDDPLNLVAVISEVALLLCVNTPDIAAPQFHQLTRLAASPNVTLQILPVAGGMNAGSDGAFTVLRFAPDQGLPDAIYQELATGGVQTTAAATVAPLHTRFGELRSQALDANESLTWLARFAAEHIQ